MTQRVKEPYQLPSGQLWWILRYADGERVSETLFTYEGENKQTWFHARVKSEILLRESGLHSVPYSVSLYEPN